MDWVNGMKGLTTDWLNRKLAGTLRCSGGWRDEGWIDGSLKQGGWLSKWFDERIRRMMSFTYCFDDSTSNLFILLVGMCS